MAVTVKADNTAQVPVLYSTELFAQAENRSFWHQFEGPEGSGFPLIRKDDLSKTAGDTIKIDLVMALKNAGITTDTTQLQGNEEKIDFRQMSFTVAPLANGVRWTELAEQLINHNMRNTALNQLQKWLAGKLDDAVWTMLTASSLPTPNKWFAGAATTIGTVTSSLYLTLSDISDLKAYAQTTLKIEPLRMENGEEFFGLVIHPWTNRQLKGDTNYQQALRDASARGDLNRLFTGATFLWDGVIGLVSNRVPTAADGSASATVSRNVFFGAQAGIRGFAQYPDWREEFFDYGREAGVATTLIKGEAANVFDFSAAKDASGNQALGHILAYAAAAAPVA
jgi:N4-gp56 family major capsid protein